MVGDGQYEMDLESARERASTIKEGEEVVPMAGMEDQGSEGWMRPFPEGAFGPQPIGHIYPPLTCLPSPRLQTHSEFCPRVLTLSPPTKLLGQTPCSLPSASGPDFLAEAQPPDHPEQLPGVWTCSQTSPDSVQPPGAREEDGSWRQGRPPSTAPAPPPGPKTWV